MGRKCTVCGEEAIYGIKDTSEYYCQECAEENFADLDLLVVLESQAQQLKDIVTKKLAPQEEEDVSHD